MFEVMLNKLDAASLAARERPLILLPTCPGIRLRSELALSAAEILGVDFAVLPVPTFFGPFLVALPEAEADAPFDFRFTPILVRVCALLFDLLLDARVNLDVIA